MELFKKKQVEKDVSFTNADELIEKVDREAKFRKYPEASTVGKLVMWLCICWSLFHMVTGGFGELVAIKQRAICLTFAMVLSFLLYPASKRANRSKPTIVDCIFIALSLFGCLYIVLNVEALDARAGVMVTMDYIAAIICIICIFEAARRTMGYVLPIMALIFILYAYFGRSLPGFLNHGGVSIRRMLTTFYTSTDGIWGSALGVSASYIILFILFGAFLSESGLGALINDVSLAVAGDKPGGPAKVAVVGSGLMGMINGSPVACCATMGAFCIPQMKSIGYKAHYAGAVEAVAATGGAIMPPVMGAAAFLVCQYTGYPYKVIMIAAIIPAFLYYFCCIMQTHFYARKVGMKGLPKEQLPKIGPVLKKSWHLLIPLVVVVYMLCAGFTAINAAFWSIICTIAASFIRKETRMTPKKILHALEAGGRGSVTIVMATAIVGFIIGCCNLTGLGMTLSARLVSLSGGHLFFTLLLTMIACVILGMGLPTTACYIVAATMLAPALTSLGVSKLAAHFYVFYLANLSNITPPVCLAAFTGAAIAGEKPSKVGWTAFRLGIIGFIVAFTFVYSSEFFLMDGITVSLVQAFITAVLGCLAMAAGLEGYWMAPCYMWERPLYIASGLLLFIPGLTTDLIGIAVIAVLLAMQFMRRNKARKVPVSSN